MSDRSRPHSRWLEALHVFALSAFAVAQPLLDLLGRNASFFVAHRASRGDVIVFLAVSLFFIPTLLIGLRVIVSKLSAAAGRTVHLATVGILAALAILPVVGRPLALGWIVVVPVAVVVGSVAALAYARWAPVGRFLTVVSPAVILFAALFLFGSQARQLIFPSARTQASERGPTRSDTPVMAVLFDELSLSSIITPDGGIDETRYPAFARLATRSTWYRDATTAGLRTDQAVPAILTGRRVPTRQVPSSFAYPDNAFSLMAQTHRVHVREFVTQLCPTELCPVAGEGERTTGLASLLTDAAIVYGHIVLPSDLAEVWLPPLGDRWAGFSRDATSKPTSTGAKDPVSAWLRSAIDERETEHEGAVLDRFLRGVKRTTGKPLFSWLHLQIPHPPWRYLPNGQTYETGTDTPGYRNFRWDADQYLANEVLQRSLLQTRFADKMLGRLLDHLEQEKVFEDTMLVVLSDHGATWERNATRRDVDGEQGAGLIGVPLFVKYPGQEKAEIDDENAETVDVLPTIADVAGVPLRWETHGTSLRSDNRRHDKRVFDGDRERRVNYTFDDSRRRAREIAELFGPGGGKDDLYAFGPHRDLLGLEAASLGKKLAVRFDREAYEDVDTRAATLPALFRGELDGGRAGIPLAVVLNGRVAGVGQTYAEDGAVRVAVMLSPRYLRGGHNRVSVMALSGPGDGGGG